MGAKRQRTHYVTIKVRTDKPILRKHAVYAAWNHVQGLEIYGRDDDDSMEPYGAGKITVPKRQ